MILLIFFLSPLITRACGIVSISMYDSQGDGWNGNVLGFVNKYIYNAPYYSATLSEGGYGTASICMQEGTYDVWCCYGSDPWASTYTASFADGSYITGTCCVETFVVTIPSPPTLTPTRWPSRRPSSNPSKAPTPIPTAPTRIPTLKAPTPPTPPPTPIPTLMPTPKCDLFDINLNGWAYSDGSSWAYHQLCFTSNKESICYFGDDSANYVTACLPSGKYTVDCCLDDAESSYGLRWEISDYDESGYCCTGDDDSHEIQIGQSSNSEDTDSSSLLATVLPLVLGGVGCAMFCLYRQCNQKNRNKIENDNFEMATHSDYAKKKKFAHVMVRSNINYTNESLSLPPRMIPFETTPHFPQTQKIPDSNATMKKFGTSSALSEQSQDFPHLTAQFSDYYAAREDPVLRAALYGYSNGK